MALTKMAFKQLVDDFNRKGIRPHGKLLTLSRYIIDFDRTFFDRVCESTEWIRNDERDKNDKRSVLLNDEFVFKALGFECLDTMDYSDFEGANIIHDLNDNRISNELAGKYDFILDAGTIEHIFLFNSVMENIFKMLKVGGTFFFDQPVFYGINHGYYNFSPVLYYEYFKVNNYKINTFTPYVIRDGVFYVVDSTVNDVLADIPLIENSYNLVWGSVTKTPKTTFDIIPYQGIYTKRWEENPYKIVSRVLDDAEKNDVYMYGTGRMALSLLKKLPVKYHHKLAGFLSNEKEEIGKIFYGHKIYGLEDVIEKGSTIVIATSKQYQNIVYERIKHVEKNGVKIVKLYQNSGIEIP